jgi:hypothetical protein
MKTERSIAAEAEDSRKQNIIGLSLGFTAMLRLFERGSADRIALMLNSVLVDLSESPDAFEAIHQRFCTSFMKAIRLNRHLRKGGRRPSYGQAAKVLDVALKACVYYSHLPDARTAERLCPKLRLAIDTPFLEYLRRTFPQADIQARTIADIDRRSYFKLQGLAVNNAKTIFGSEILPVQYDDIMWRKLNRTSQQEKSPAV